MDHAFDVDYLPLPDLLSFRLGVQIMSSGSLPGPRYNQPKINSDPEFLIMKTAGNRFSGPSGCCTYIEKRAQQRPARIAVRRLEIRWNCGFACSTRAGPSLEFGFVPCIPQSWDFTFRVRFGRLTICLTDLSPSPGTDLSLLVESGQRSILT
ncbi:hypothetical protein B0H11DRAFT_1340475 [Mycena galericulata]|nr:hypothetical protein B0H11DRAFT_1340475 [Mycena galericulata]